MSDQPDTRADVDRSSSDAVPKAEWGVPKLTTLGDAATVTNSGGAGKNDGLASS